MSAAIAPALAGCALIASIDSRVDDSTGTTPTPGSPSPAKGHSDPSLSPPPATDCGDVTSSADNCGWCGHSCRGGACREGRCEERVIVSAPSIDAFVTDGVMAYIIAGGEPRACKVDGPADQVCTPVVSAEEVEDFLDQGEFPRGGGVNVGIGGAGPKPPKPLEAKALALLPGRLVIADDAHEAVLVCPTTGECDEDTLAAVDASDWDPKPVPFGPSLAVGPTGLTWTQGNALAQASLPPTGEVLHAINERRAQDTENTARVLAPAGIFWLSSAGLHHSPSINDAPQRWSTRSAFDFSVDGEQAYLATQEGLLRVGPEGSDKGEVVAAEGAYLRVAAAGGSVYAARSVGDGAAIVDVRMGMQLELATVQGAVVSLAVAGDWVHYLVTTDGRAEVRRVPR